MAPIVFDNNGEMEVDLFCDEARLAVELDGAQHLNDPDAYRRDRRKDALLQQNGFFVLRFLAEDLGKYLDQVLDAILAALAPENSELLSDLGWVLCESGQYAEAEEILIEALRIDPENVRARNNLEEVQHRSA